MGANDNDPIDNDTIKKITDDINDPDQLLHKINEHVLRCLKNESPEQYYRNLEELLVTVERLRSIEFFENVDYDDYEETSVPRLTLVVDNN